MAKPDEKQLARINRLALESTFEAGDVEIFQFLAADQQLTAHQTKFDIRTLRKFKRDMLGGDTALLVNHNQRGMLPLGRSFAGMLDTNGDTKCQMYIPLKDAFDRERDEAMTVASGFKQGTNYDVSVGIHATFYECSICGDDVRSYKCAHWPGQRYNIAKENEAPNVQTCFATIHGTKTAKDEDGEEYYIDVSCSELSCVVDGAVERAGVEPISFSCGEDGEIKSMQLAGAKFEKKSDGAGLGQTKLCFTAKAEAIPGSSENSSEPPPAAKPTEVVTDVTAMLDKYAEVKVELKTLQDKYTTLQTESNAEKETAETRSAAFAKVIIEAIATFSIRLQGNDYETETEAKKLAQLSPESLAAEYATVLAMVEAQPSGRITYRKKIEATSAAVLADSAFASK
jgi:hypothetical protein